ANALRLHFLGQTFGKQQIEALGGGISRNERYSLERSSRSDNQDVPGPALNHLRKKKMRQMNDGRAVDLNHSEKPFLIHRCEWTIRTKTGVVDEHINGKAPLASEIENLLGRSGL